MNKNIKQLKKIPHFKSEDEERDFWTNHDSSEFLNWRNSLKNPVLPNLKPSTKTISLRLPLTMLDQLKEMSNKKDVPYQSYIKIILDEKINQNNYTKKI
jgi:predicted DNA binding CopG/RHH family protein